MYSRNGIYTDTKTQFKIYALFLLADGQWRPEERTLLHTIGNEIDLDKDVKSEIISYCKGLGITEGDHSAKVIQEIDQALSDSYFSSLQYDPRVQAETVWTLINLGYADQDYSEPEKRVVQHLIETWEIRPAVVSEFIDTAETILLLTKQESWLKSLALPYDETKKRLEIVDQQIQLMFDNIQAAISEADAV